MSLHQSDALFYEFRVHLSAWKQALPWHQHSHWYWWQPRSNCYRNPRVSNGTWSKLLPCSREGLVNVNHTLWCIYTQAYLSQFLNSRVYKVLKQQHSSNSHFPGQAARMTDMDNWNYKPCEAPVSHHQYTTTQLLIRRISSLLPNQQCQELSREKVSCSTDLLTASSPGVIHPVLITKGSWLPVM